MARKSGGVLGGDTPQLQRQSGDDFEAVVAEDENHHYVPQLLLEQWCGNDSKLKAYSRPHGRVVTSPRGKKGTGFEVNLYSISTDDLKNRHILERNFMTPAIDTPAAKIVQKILAGDFTKLTTEERSDFSRFLMSLRARHPDGIKLAKEMGRSVLTDALARDPEEYIAVRGQASASNLLEWTKQHVPHLVENFGMSNLPALITDDKIAQRIFSMSWWIRNASQANVDLLLSDRPCLVQGSAIEGDCLIILPISPTVVFFACNQPDTIKKVLSTPISKLVKSINKISAASASERVFGTGDQHLPLVEKLLGTSKS